MKSVRLGYCRSFFLVAVLFATGCSGGLYEVTGKVTLDGKPVKGLEVTFEPKDPNLGTVATGYTQDDGSYRLYYPGDKTGAPAGEYVVRISGSEVVDGEPIRVASKYNSKTELSATVKSSANVFNFDVTSQ